MGSNPTQSTRTFSYQEKFHQKKQFSPPRSSNFPTMYLPVNIVRYDGEEIDGHLREFEAFLRVDLDEQPATVKEHLRYVKGFLAGG
ncbi:MAG: hypothetical protein N3D12_06755, partial [Candidatus Methanomethyliaceae archaeon]|nr:hypothetical protein [Candidatus Methanomethyliaceae archaeon]